MFILGVAPAALYACLVFVPFHAAFIHASVRWQFPVLRWLIWTPALRHWHDTSDGVGIDKNFANSLPLWDLLFGTAHLPHLPRHWPRNYGTANFQCLETYLGQLSGPFRRRCRATADRWLPAGSLVLPSGPSAMKVAPAK